MPIHEIHENEPKHHSATALPAVSMADFKKQGGSLTGREERYDGFEGEPRAVGSSLGGSPAIGGTTGMDSDMSRTGNTGTGSGYGTTSYGTGNTGTGSSGYGNNTGSGTSYDNSTGSTGKKPSLLDRLNRKISSSLA